MLKNQNAKITDSQLPDQRVLEIYKQHAEAQYARTSQHFAILMILQWASAICLALFISPWAWNGSQATLHVHVYAALFLGALLTLPTVILCHWQPTSSNTRYAVAVAQMLMSALLIHLTGGRIETHFHVFASLAFLAFYRDWKVLLIASLVIATDHIFRGLWWPYSVFGLYTPSILRSLEHAGWVIFQDIFLLISINNINLERLKAATAFANLEGSEVNTPMEVERQTNQLLANQSELQNLLLQVDQAKSFQNAVLNGANFSIIATNVEGIIQLFNAGAEKLLGYSAEQVVGRETPAAFHDAQEVVQRAQVLSSELGQEILPGFETFIAKARTGVADENEWTYVHKDGSRLPVMLSITTLLDNEGTITGYVGIAKDISLQKQAQTENERALEEIRQIRSALDQHAIVSIADVRGRITYVNDKFCAISKYTRQELIGQDHRLVNSGYHSKEFMRDLWRTIAQGNPWHGEVKNKAKDGTFYWMATSIVPFLDQNGKPVQYISIRTDISTQKAAEQDLAVRAEQAVLLHQIADSASATINIEEALSKCIALICNYTGWPVGHAYILSADDLREGTAVLKSSKIWHLENTGNYQNFVELTEKTDFLPGIGLPGRIYSSKKPVWIPDVHCDPNFPQATYAKDIGVVAAFGFPVTINGQVEAVLEFYNNNQHEPDQRLIAFVTQVATNLAQVIQKQKSATEILTINENLSRSNQELADFAYVVSHDLKAPLRGVNSIATWLADDYADKLDEDGREQLKLMSTRIDRMHGLIEGILQYSRVGREKFELAAVDLQTAVLSIIDLLAIPDAIKTTIDTPLPSIRFEDVRIRQVFQNLLSNAVKYMGKPTGEIHVGYQEVNDEMLFYVKDTGTGIESKYFHKIFQLFQTLQARDDYESTGVGLALIKKIIEAKGGRVWVESVLGQGSTFWFSLPRKLLLKPNHKAIHDMGAVELQNI